WAGFGLGLKRGGSNVLKYMVLEIGEFGLGQAGRVSPDLNAACSYAGIRTMPLFKAKNAFSELLYSSVCEQYNVLKSAIHGKQGLAASTPTVSLSQPWE
ncbi:UNVERIFIED_CONTAM: Glycerol-3-phosphate acyltransferase, chloroplastic, partial [Sesamum radiatum]